VVFISEIPLISQENHPSLIFKTTILGVENIDETISNNEQPGSFLYKEVDSSKIMEDAIALYDNFTTHGNMKMLEKAILQFQMLARLVSEDHPEFPLILNNLGIALGRRFEELDYLADLNNSMMYFQVAINFTPDNHPNRPRYLSNLGNTLGTRFQRLGNLTDIDHAISQHQVAVDLVPDNHLEKPNHLLNLGISLQIRFQHFGNLIDIDQAIKNVQAAVDLIPEGHPDKPDYLSNLGSLLAVRFQYLGDIADINHAIVRQEAAFNLTPDHHSDKCARFQYLGQSLMARFRSLGHFIDIDHAIARLHAAVDLSPSTHPHKPSRLNSLGFSFYLRFLELGDFVDIDNAISYQQAAVKLTPDGHPEKPTFLDDLGTSFYVRFEHFRNIPNRKDSIARSDSYDAQAALSYLSAAATSPVGPPKTRFCAAKKWIHVASLLSHHSLFSAYDHAFRLMPIVTWLGLPAFDQQESLVTIDETARDAAAVAISLGKYKKALEWLEQGRHMVWNQMLQLQTPVDQLHDVNPELADRLIHISRLLDQGTRRGDLREGYIRTKEEEVSRYRALTTEWNTIIEQVRALPSFENFLKSPTSSALMMVPQQDPVIILNMTKNRCDALAIVSGVDEVIHIPLPNITSSRVAELRDELKDQLYSNGIRMKGESTAERINDDKNDGGCEDILAELWNGLVRPVMGSLVFSVKTSYRHPSKILTTVLPVSSRYSSTNLVVCH
jgi:tetratricopeptide (TPR) repeat protein